MALQTPEQTPEGPVLPSSAPPKPVEPSGPIGNARASHCIHPHLPGGGNAPHQLNHVMSENGSERASASRINSATAYSNVNRNFSAMAAGSQSELTCAIALTLYATGVAICVLMIAAYTRPFTGEISVGPDLLQQVITRETASGASAH
jgi:hypothetical protein